MALAAETNSGGRAVPPLKLSRTFHASPETVFRAWTSAEHVKRWFCPEGTTITEATVEPRAGGVLAYRMRFGSGDSQWVRGVFVAAEPSARIVLDLQVYGPDDRPLFRARTEVSFSETLGGARLDIVQTYSDVDPAIAEAIAAGGEEGWGSTLEKLETEVLAMRGANETGERSAAHATFHLTRTYPSPVERVWKALTVAEAKLKWFAGTPGEWELLERTMDIRVGGSERLKGRWKSGVVTDFQAVYHDVIPNERLVYSYVMHLNDKKISVSLATLELRAEGSGTTLAVTEQGVFLDGYDDAGSREHGTGLLLDALGASLLD